MNQAVGLPYYSPQSTNTNYPWISIVIITNIITIIIIGMMMMMIIIILVIVIIIIIVIFIVAIVVIVIVIVNQTATALLWMMYHLGSYPDVQDQLYQEFERVVGKDGNITSNNIGKLSFLKACLKESMRYFA